MMINRILITSVYMNLGQLECPLDLELAEGLSLSLEEQAISVSWYEVKPEKWAFQALFKEDQEILLYEKLKSFFMSQNLPVPHITKNIVSDRNWVAAVYQNFPALTIGRFYIYGSHVQEPRPKDLISLHIEAASAF